MLADRQDKNYKLAGDSWQLYCQLTIELTKNQLG